MNRSVGLVISAVVVAGAALLWTAVMFNIPVMSGSLRESVFGMWTYLYSLDVPAPQVLAAAVSLAIVFAAGINLLEWRITNRLRRSLNILRTPLAPKIIMEQTRGVFAGEVSITVLIPAYNEETTLSATLTSLLSQSHRPERVIVVADNCTDDTTSIAHSFGIEVFETRANRQKKAGALNQVLSVILPLQGDNDVIMVLDADTTLDPGFLESGVRRFEGDRALMAVGGLFYGESGGGILGQMQRNEYLRYSSHLKRRRGRVFVLTGTASMFRARALREVARSRGTALPGTPGDVYDTHALTEDNELTLALKTLGALITSPSTCTVVTEVMPTLRALWVQRLRWQRGALENIGSYGLTPPTVRYWAQQLGIGYSVIALTSFLCLMLVTLLALDQWIWFPFWLGLGTIFTLERVVTVWKGGFWARLLAVTVIPELLFDIYLNLIYVKGIIDISRGRDGLWGTEPAGPPMIQSGRPANRIRSSDGH